MSTYTRTPDAFTPLRRRLAVAGRPWLAGALLAALLLTPPVWANMLEGYAVLPAGSMSLFCPIRMWPSAVPRPETTNAVQPLPGAMVSAPATVNVAVPWRVW